jgi:cysteine desulfurase/selenocysteine lyase
MRKGLQESLPPFLGGGNMIRSVGFEGASWNSPPHKYEAGTPNAAGAVGLAAAVSYIRGIGIGKIAAHEQRLRKICIEELSLLEGIEFYGPKKGAGIVSFNIGKMHAHDAGEFANREGVAIRAGHHCAMPLMKLLGVPATCRASFYLYNTEEEVERLAASMKKAQMALG